ncbi:hypothetical protein HDU76_009078, partial [Blyttiomyces sp. JEL0837]
SDFKLGIQRPVCSKDSIPGSTPDQTTITILPPKPTTTLPPKPTTTTQSKPQSRTIPVIPDQNQNVVNTQTIIVTIPVINPTSTPPPSQTSISSSGDSGSSRISPHGIMVLVGSAVGVLCLGLVVVFGLFRWRKYYGKKKKEETSANGNDNVLELEVQHNPTQPTPTAGTGSNPTTTTSTPTEDYKPFLYFAQIGQVHSSNRDSDMFSSDENFPNLPHQPENQQNVPFTPTVPSLIIRPKQQGSNEEPNSSNISNSVETPPTQIQPAHTTSGTTATTIHGEVDPINLARYQRLAESREPVNVIALEQEFQRSYGSFMGWSHQLVMEWARLRNFESVVIGFFTNYQIDGPTIDMLTMTTLQTKYEISDFRVRAKIMQAVQFLRHSSIAPGDDSFITNPDLVPLPLY